MVALRCKTQQNTTKHDKTENISLYISIVFECTDTKYPVTNQSSKSFPVSFVLFSAYISQDVQLVQHDNEGAETAQVECILWLQLIGLIMHLASLAGPLAISLLAKGPAIQDRTGLLLVSVYLTFSFCLLWAQRLSSFPLW